MLGLFPNPGQNVYLITPPFFESVEIATSGPLSVQKNKTTARVRSINFDSGNRNLYIQNATLDGRPFTKSWVDHSFFTQGKELVLTLGAEESDWGRRVDDLPPSLGRYEGFDRGNGTVKVKRRRETPLGKEYNGSFIGGMFSRTSWGM